jgi:hypothetical protein
MPEGATDVDMGRPPLVDGGVRLLLKEKHDMVDRDKSTSIHQNGFSSPLTTTYKC